MLKFNCETIYDFNYVYETPVKLSFVYLDLCAKFMFIKRSHESEFKVNLTIVVLNLKFILSMCWHFARWYNKKAYGLQCV